MTNEFVIEPLSEDALLLRFGDTVDPAINARVQATARVLRDANLPGISDIVPAYASLLVRFDPLAEIVSGTTFPGDALRDAMQRIIADTGIPEGAMSRSIEVPVCYGGEYGPDLGAVATHAGISEEATVARHAAGEYTVAMLGFAPGFPYLLGLDPSLHVPRRANPRVRVPPGSVAIGGAQTGIYPRELPGGWNLIGRTPLTLFTVANDPPALLSPGDHVRFRAIDADEFARLSEHAA